MHTIIITHRNRNRFLKWCLWSIERSEAVTGIGDYQVLVVDANSDVEPEPPIRGGVIRDRSHGRMFNKAKLQNIGIVLAGDSNVLTFLDADAIVGSHWLEAIRCLETPSLTVLSYRVKLLLMNDFVSLEQYPEQAEAIVNGWFVHYDEMGRFTTSSEFYGDTDSIYEGPNAPPPFGRHIFGNSQISLRRETIRSLYYDERFEGRGCEDQLFLRAIHRRYENGYCAALMTEPRFAMFHAHNPQPMTDDDDWNNKEARRKNQQLYEAS